jgi:hypothetical protein
MAKGKWSRNGPRPKFIVTCVSDQELDLARVTARSMNMSVSAMLRQLLIDQYYRLATGNYVPIPEQSLDLKIEV